MSIDCIINLYIITLTQENQMALMSVFLTAILPSLKEIFDA
jgi:hypothetical protein